jgi:D-alanine-D-alanine ligase
MELLQKFKQPVLVETYLSGREFTVGIVGTGAEAEVVGVMEVHLSAKDNGVYAFETKAEYIGRVEYSLCYDALGKASGALGLSAWRSLGCRDGGRVDVRADANGLPHFIEVNPLAGLNPADSDLPIMWRMQGKKYPDLIKRILDSALARC